MNNKNKGKFLETIINKTLNYYWENNIAFIEKKGLDIWFKEVEHNNFKLKLNNAVIAKKSTVDYIGMYEGRFICFEAKTTQEDRFNLQNIKQHQLNYLNLIQKNGGIAFFIIYFSHRNKFLKVNLEFINKYFDSETKSFMYKDVLKESKELELNFPCVLEFI
ncbi:Holliday junction resolvase RecU [Mycoplasma leonicaptivi]|uniref:Holliday junction resolvase RecU n=1 Tax=Mycoplasma leonicaptivi TaxID=36742 RepID=UPI000484FED2|nr:Holliday junction resolvase RecU [Mycoplasma leonicaptivi]